MTNSNQNYDPRKTIKGTDAISNALVKTTQKGYADKIYCDALDFLKDKQLSLKQIAWVTYWSAQNHPKCKKQIEQFLDYRLKNISDDPVVDKQEIAKIIEGYRKTKNSKYVDGILNWFNDL